VFTKQLSCGEHRAELPRNLKLPQRNMILTTKTPILPPFNLFFNIVYLSLNSPLRRQEKRKRSHKDKFYIPQNVHRREELVLGLSLTRTVQHKAVSERC
jgi:hypothetical protein